MVTNPEQENDQDNMVLRTVYFPIEMDEQLKLLAFNKSTSKGELIRRAVRLLMSEVPEADRGEAEAAGEGTEAGAREPGDGPSEARPD